MRARTRRAVGVLLLLVAAALWVYQTQVAPSTGYAPEQPPTTMSNSAPQSTTPLPDPSGNARDILETLAVKGRAPKTNYARTQFGNGWLSIDGCDTRNVILHRDLSEATVNSSCKVTGGVLHDPYTGKIVQFVRGATTSDLVQIDHVVALSDAWQKGAQALTFEQRVELANDALELLAVDGSANQAKADGDAATWLPANKAFRCQYVARQIAVKAKYGLWVTPAEKAAMLHVLEACPDEPIPTAAQK